MNGTTGPQVCILPELPLFQWFQRLFRIDSFLRSITILPIEQITDFGTKFQIS